MDTEKLISRSIEKAKEFLVEGEIAGALALSGQLCKCDPDNQEANMLSGICKHLISDMVQQNQGAIDSLEKAIPNAFAYNALALCYEKIGELQKARRFFERAIEINDADEFKTNLAICLLKMKDPLAEEIMPKFVENPKILVGSVFANDDEFQNQLLDIQLKALQETCDFDHVVCLGEKATNDTFKQKTKVIAEGWQGENPHVWGLEKLIQYFRPKQLDYDYFLILDSDAFPIRKDWVNYLTSKLSPKQCFDNEGRFCFAYGSSFEIATVLRRENLEERLHASVLFAKRESLHNLYFEYQKVGNDILNRSEVDICIPYYQFKERGKCYPLIRTNKTNVHPIVAGIYGDCFYHHGAGTRNNLVFRSNVYHDYCKDQDASEITKQLLADPFGFVNSLGWGSNYIDISG